MGSSFVTADFIQNASIVLGGTSALGTSSLLMYKARGDDHDGDIATLYISNPILVDLRREHLHDTTEQDEETRHPRARRVPTGLQISVWSRH